MLNVSKCWTCGTEHDPDAACGAPAVVVDDDPFVSPSDQPVPVIKAWYATECSGCEGDIGPGDLIRADSYGGWEHADHAD